MINDFSLYFLLSSSVNQIYFLCRTTDFERTTHTDACQASPDAPKQWLHSLQIPLILNLIRHWTVAYSTFCSCFSTPLFLVFSLSVSGLYLQLVESGFTDQPKDISLSGVTACLAVRQRLLVNSYLWKLPIEKSMEAYVCTLGGLSVSVSLLLQYSSHHIQKSGQDSVSILLTPVNDGCLACLVQLLYINAND